MLKKRKIFIWFFTGLALFFYAVSWSVTQYGDMIWYIGIGLPWLSLFVGVALDFICSLMFNSDIFEKKYGAGYLYSGCTVLYVITSSLIAKSLYPFIPHLSACACFIAVVYIDGLYKELEDRRKKIKESADFLQSKLESIDKLAIQINESENEGYRNQLTELLLVQISEGYNTLSKISVVEEYEEDE